MRKLALSDENLYKQKVTQNISTFRNIILAIIVCTEDRQVCLGLPFIELEIEEFPPVYRETLIMENLNAFL